MVSWLSASGKTKLLITQIGFMNTKISLMAILVAILVIVSGFLEIKHCHFWTTQEPIGAPSDYIKYTGFCQANKYTGAIGAFILSPFLHQE